MEKYIIKSIYVSLLLIFSISACAQPLHQKGKFTKQDTLRGSITPERAWWNVLYYDINVTPDYKTKTIKGQVKITYNIIKQPNGKVKMQIDLQEPMRIDRVFSNDGQTVSVMKTPTGGGSNLHQLARQLKFTRQGNVYYIEDAPAKNNIDSITIEFSGAPRAAVNPPWDGGWIWGKDAKGRPWMTVACQGLGASVWYPCKDHQSDEPDLGASLSITVPDTLVAVANGRLAFQKDNRDGTTTWKWEVKSPINNYNIVPYIGKYVHWSDNYIGETEKNLSLDYWVLDYNLEKSKKQFGQDVKPMLKAFEYWFGPYPFYEDGYKLVESSHLGMEHQSAVAYGNHYQNGYLGMDLSGSGWGLKWDYIIVHESGHEWFANNITTNDIADMWIHEGFTMYSEVLFTEYHYGKKAGDEYLQGIRKKISNDKPLIGPYGVNQEGSSDMYNKGASLLHTIRQIINDDSVFRKILRGLNSEFYHKTVDSKDVEAYFSKIAGIDLSKVFDQYLRTIKIPQLEYKIVGDNLSYRWANCVNGFAMPVKLEGVDVWLKPTTEWKSITMTAELMSKTISTSKNFYVTTRKVE
ncbi:MAG: M1 family metallopeptidase [Chitinophagaceae bacterium]|nr:M1 family metallopeptidase [Chitinophagaceae bacterium]